MSVNGTQSNKPSFYILFNVGVYHNTTSMVESCCNHIRGNYIILSSMKNEFRDRIRCLKTFTELFLSYNEHPNRINIQTLFFSRTADIESTLSHTNATISL